MISLFLVITGKQSFEKVSCTKHNGFSINGAQSIAPCFWKPKNALKSVRTINDGFDAKLLAWA